MLASTGEVFKIVATCKASWSFDKFIVSLLKSGTPVEEEKLIMDKPAGFSLQHYTIKILFAVVILSTGFLYLVAHKKGAPEVATVKMVCGLILLWIVIGGTLMYRFRDLVREHIQRMPFDWRVKFALFSTTLALIEEAFAVSMTNLAPLLGVKTGEAYITASTNYFDVVLFHSVVVFVPLFIAWAVLLSRYNFSPFSVFLLFGLMGIVCEASINPAGALFGFAQWIFIYGLMVYLPAYCIPMERGALAVRWYHYMFAIPLAFLIAVPLLLPIMYVVGNVLQHPQGTHF